MNMSDKNGKISIAPKHFVLAGVLAVLVLTLVLLQIQTRNQTRQAVVETPGTLTEKVEETIENGVYTNYTYGFRFEYPSEKFKLDPNGRLVYQNSGGIQYILLVSTAYPDNEYRDWYEQIFALLKDETTLIKHQYSTLLSKTDKDDYRLAITSTKTKQDAETEHSVGYQAIWLIPSGLTITVSMLGDPEISEEFVLNNKLIFDQIVKSFEFTNQ